MSTERELLPRVLRAQEAARYCGFRADGPAFKRWLKLKGVSRISGRRQAAYDRQELDDAIEKKTRGMFDGVDW